MTSEMINPESLGAPKGYSNGVLAPRGGRVLFIAGQTAWKESRPIENDDFTTQFARALENVLAVVREAGGEPEDIARLTVYVTDRRKYVDARREIGRAYQKLMGKHYPAMAMIEVKGLFDERALVELEATAVLS